MTATATHHGISAQATHSDNGTDYGDGAGDAWGTGEVGLGALFSSDPQAMVSLDRASYRP